MQTCFLLLLSFVVVCSPPSAFGQEANREEVLNAVFPGAKIESSMVFLTRDQMKQIEKLSGTTMDTALIARYRAVQNGKEVGRAYLDTHVVRTKKESLLIILQPDGKVKRVEIVAFLEPQEYIPSERWYMQFEQKELSDSLRLQAAIQPVTGATLTAQATTTAVRRVLAVDQVLQKKETSR